MKIYIVYIPTECYECAGYEDIRGVFVNHDNAHKLKSELNLKEIHLHTEKYGKPDAYDLRNYMEFAYVREVETIDDIDGRD